MEIEKMPLPSVEQFIGANVTEQGFKNAQKQLVEYVGNEVSKKVDTYTKAEVDTTFAAYVGGRKSYKTLALAQADQANLPVNTAIEVTNDGANNGTYQWDGTTLTKSAYDPLTQAKAYTDSSLDPIKTVKVGRNNLDLSVGALTGSAATTIFGSPVSISGSLEKIHGSFETNVTAVKVKVFNLSGSTFTEAASAVVSIKSSETVHLLDSLLSISAGQYLGFYCIGGKPKGSQTGTHPAIYAAVGDVTSVQTTAKYTNTDWQIYFEVGGEVKSRIVEVDIKTRKNEAGINSLSRIVDIISTLDKYGRNGTPVAGDLTASKTYIPFAKEVENTGEVVSAEFYLQAADSVSLFVAKRISETTYEIVKESPYQSCPAGLNSINLKEQGVSLPVNAGDIIGWSALGKQVGFLSSTSADDLGYLAVDKNGNILTQTTVYTNTQPQISITVLAVEKPLRLVVMSQLDYDALSVKDPNTIYGVV